MRKAFILIGALLVTAAPAVTAKERLSGEAELAKTLEGRVAGEPVHCLHLHEVRTSQIIDHTAILYEVGSTIYVNRPHAGLESLDRWDTLVTKTSTDELCSIDVVQLYDPQARMQTGTVFLSEFVPYKKPRK